MSELGLGCVKIGGDWGVVARRIKAMQSFLSQDTQWLPPRGGRYGLSIAFAGKSSETFRKSVERPGFDSPVTKFPVGVDFGARVDGVKIRLKKLAGGGKCETIDQRSGSLVRDDHARPCAGSRSTEGRRRARQDRGLERNGQVNSRERHRLTIEPARKIVPADRNQCDTGPSGRVQGARRNTPRCGRSRPIGPFVQLESR